MIDALAHSASCPTWLKYPERMTDKLNIPMLKRHAALVRELHSLASNMSFSKASMEAAFRSFLDKRCGEWRLEQKHYDEWVKVNAARVRAMCRHVSNALCKKQKASWLSEVLLLGDETAHESEPEHAQEEARVARMARRSRRTRMRRRRMRRRSSSKSATPRTATRPMHSPPAISNRGSR